MSSNLGWSVCLKRSNWCSANGEMIGFDVGRGLAPAVYRGFMINNRLFAAGASPRPTGSPSMFISPTNPNLNISNSPTFKFGFVGVFIFGGVASLAPSGRGLPRSGWRSPAARRIKARKIAIFLGHAEIISSKIASSRGLPQSPSAPAPSRREPYNSTSNSTPRNKNAGRAAGRLSLSRHSAAAATAATVIVIAGAQDQNGDDDQPDGVILKQTAEAVIHTHILLDVLESRSFALLTTKICLCPRNVTAFSKKGEDPTKILSPEKIFFPNRRTTRPLLRLSL